MLRPIRSPWERTIPHARFGRALLSLALLGLLAACASKPQISAQQEASQYLARARGDYTPPGPPSDPWGPYIRQASTKYDVPEVWIREVIRQESGGRLYHNGSLVTSGAGAMGLMQVMPGTYDELRARYSLDDDPYHPLNNILAGTAYIREMYDIYGNPGFLAAYNAGPGRLDDYLTRGRGLPDETRRYVARVGTRIADTFPDRRSPAEGTMMAQLPIDIPAGSRYASRGSDSRYAYDPRYDMASVQAPVRTVAAASPAPARYTYDPRYDVAAVQPPVPPAPPATFASASPRYAPDPRYDVAAVQPPVPPAAVARRYAGGPAYALPAYALNDAPRESARPTPPARQQAVQSVQLAELPVPPRPMLPPAPPPQQFAAMSPPPRPLGFSLVSQAAAEPIGIRRAPAGGSWAVQVGAFPNDRIAVAEATAAQNKARDVLGGARPHVTGVRGNGGMMYRARLTGLSRDAAVHACERLARSRTQCMIISPDAQS